MLDLAEMFSKNRMLFGDSALENFKKAKILLIGVGGVGGAVLQALARSGIIHIDVVDGDKFSYSNINRQIFATTKNIGQKKVLVSKKRILEINPYIKIKAYDFFYCEEKKDLINLKNYDFIVDAIDSVSDKLLLIKNAKRENIKIISSMGAGRKTNPKCILIDDIYKTYNCPLAKIIRKKLREEKIESLTVCFSTEKPKKNPTKSSEKNEKLIASSYFVPNAIGNLVAWYVVSKIMEN